MLKKEFRLLEPISKNAKTLSTAQFLLRYSENGQGKSRFAFVVSKKIDRRSVVRNRIKRLLRSSVEDNIERIKKGNDYLFILKKELIGKEKKEIDSYLKKSLLQENLYD